jgi:hypothetical protein
MPRIKGSKNKNLQAKIDDIVKNVIELGGDSKETAEAIAEIEDLLETPKKKEPKAKVFLGYHPITKEEVYL